MFSEKFKRNDNLVGRKYSFITFRQKYIALNSKLVKEGDLKKYSSVNVFFDCENYKIAFRFHNDKNDNDSFCLILDNKLGGGLNISGVSIYKKYKWIDAVAKLKDKDFKKFIPEYDNKERRWIISLMPSFEIQASREFKISRNLKGIYRYVRKNGEIVYIGKGKISDRKNSIERRTWDFDKIEYSIIENSKLREKSESYWLEKYKEQNNNNLPFYNKISGKKCITSI